VTEVTEGPQQEGPREHLVHLVYQVILADQPMAQTAVMERGDHVAFPEFLAFLDLPGLRDLTAIVNRHSASFPWWRRQCPPRTLG